MSWLCHTKLKDLPEDQTLECCCLRCRHTWLMSTTQVLIRVCHRDVYLDEVARNLTCQRPGCRHAGVRLNLVHSGDTSGFVGGMP